MAARKKASKTRTTKKPAPRTAAPRRAKVSAKPKAKKPTAKKPTAKKPTAKKPATRTAAKAKPASRKSGKAKLEPTTKAALPRRDATGHLNPKYAADLRARIHDSSEDRGNDPAFLRKSGAHDVLAEELAEDAVLTMTSGEDQSDRLQDLEVEEESGGPFVTTSGREEFAGGTDKSNPFDATREPFPTT